MLHARALPKIGLTTVQGVPISSQQEGAVGWLFSPGACLTGGEWTSSVFFSTAVYPAEYCRRAMRQATQFQHQGARCVCKRVQGHTFGSRVPLIPVCRQRAADANVSCDRMA